MVCFRSFLAIVLCLTFLLHFQLGGCFFFFFFFFFFQKKKKILPFLRNDDIVFDFLFAFLSEKDLLVRGPIL